MEFPSENIPYYVLRTELGKPKKFTSLKSKFDLDFNTWGVDSKLSPVSRPKKNAWRVLDAQHICVWLNNYFFKLSISRERTASHGKGKYFEGGFSNRRPANENFWKKKRKKEKKICF